MQRGNGSRAWVAVLGIVVGASLAGPNGSTARAQAVDDALRDRVAQLLERLESPKAETQDGAEQALIKLGPKVLPLIPEPGPKTSPAARERLERIRAALNEATTRINPAATRVTLQGQRIRLTEAIQQLQAQTGNPITDVREQYGVEATNPSLDLDLQGLTFLEALDRVAEKAQVRTTYLTGDGTLGLMAGTGPMGEALPTQYSGPFRVRINQIGILRDFLNGASTANLQLEIGWEPRLRPLLLALKSEETTVTDDRGKVVPPDVMEMQTELAVRPENPGAEINLNLSAPDREARKLASLKFKADLTIPAGLRVFRFPSLTATEVVQKQGDIVVTLNSMEVEEQVWKVNVTVAYPGGGPAFESYRQGLFNNRLWLQRADGSRFEHNGGYSNTAAGDGELGFEYLFVDAPGKPADYQFVYETPSELVTIPLEVEFKDIPLP